MQIFHALIKIHTQNSNGLSDSDKASALNQSISDLLGTTIVDSVFHEFGPSGLTGVSILKESHISIHTWPEENLIVLDILSCKLPNDIFKIELEKAVKSTYSISTIESVFEEI